MTKPPPDAWLDSEGKVISVADVIDALTVSASLILREITTNTGLISNQRMVGEYKRKGFIINRVKQSFERSLMLSKEATLKIPKKKKKGERSH